MKRIIYIIVLSLWGYLSGMSQTLTQRPPDKLGSATVEVRGDTIGVNTGKISRKWRWTGKGLVTVSIQDEIFSLEGMLEFEIDNPADYSFISYKVL